MVNRTDNREGRWAIKPMARIAAIDAAAAAAEDSSGCRSAERIIAPAAPSSWS